MLVENKNNLRKKKPVPMTISAHSIQGRRTHMEDFFDTGYKLKPCDQIKPNEWPYEYFYFAIFDGHGGDDAANYARDHLMEHITSQKGFWASDDDKVMQAIREGYASCQKGMREIMPQWKRNGKIPLPSTAGTTASIIIIRNGKFYSGHVGDSRIVIAREDSETHQWIASQITEDHKPESDEEMVRIKRAGGEVRDKIGVSRVVWKRPILKDHDSIMAASKGPNHADYSERYPSYPIEESLVASYQTIPFLAIARSLGDFWSINPHSGQYIVSPEPDVSCRPITRYDKCILLATDGLWNVVNSCQASRFLQELYTIKREKKANHKKEYYSVDNFYDVAGSTNENYAVSLVYFAYQIWERRRIRADNITAVVAMLGDILEPLTSIDSKPYNTRDKNLSCDLQKSFNPKNMTEFIKLQPTSTYYEEITLDSKPKFMIDENAIFELNESLRKLEDYLLFPPTIVHKKFGAEFPQLGMPRNYIRLALADYKKIKRPDTSVEAYIHIKTASDDPADRAAGSNVRKSHSTGKMVKDASSQATQSIHDFGQPWKTMRSFSADEEDLDKDECQDGFDWYLDEDDELEDDFDSDGDELELVYHYMLKPGDVVVHRDRKGKRYSYRIPDPDLDYNGDDNIENEDDSDNCESDEDEDGDKSSGESSDENESLDSNGSTVTSKAKRNKANREVSQLRCLMNRTPYKRTTRSGTYLSVTEKPRRKLEHARLPKSKRRRSHPVNCSYGKT